MKYVLLVYDAPGSWDDLPTEQRRALHRNYHTVAELPGVIAHYRLRPPETAATVRVDQDRIATIEGPLVDTKETLRAIYLIESDDHDAVLRLAAQIPAARMGGAVEVWTLAGH